MPPVQTIDSDTLIQQLGIPQTIPADAFVKKPGLRQFLTAEFVVSSRKSQTISAETTIVVNPVVLQLFAQSDLSTELGTVSNPITFGTIEAGTAVVHPDNPFVLFNDKGGLVQSVDAREITVSVVRLDLVDELEGFSSGIANQSFSVGFPPVLLDPFFEVKVQDVRWTRVSTFAGLAPSDEAYTFNEVTGTITFGDGIQGKIPPAGHSIKCSYTPDTLLFGREVSEQLWVGVQSSGVISNPVTVLLEIDTPTDTLHVPVQHTPMLGVSGVFLHSDPHRLGTNFFSGGSFDAVNGIITLGTLLPDTNDVLVDYTYAIADDAEGGFTHIGRTVKHTFANPIPKNNAKRLNFRVVVPQQASPSGLAEIRFKLRFEYKE